MKAITYDTYGPPEVLRFRAIDKPALTDDSILVRVRAAALNPLDWHFMRADPFLVRLMTGLFSPTSKRLGADMAGVVEATGKNVTTVKVGDEVMGCVRGAFADYVLVSKAVLAPKPPSLTFEEAAAIPIAAITALQALRDKGQLQQGHNVLINGASGGVGTFAIQIARAIGANVHATCSTRNVDLVRTLGADHVIDYTKADLLACGKTFNVILDTVGNYSLAQWSTLLTDIGRYVGIGGNASTFEILAGAIQMGVKSFGSKKYMAFMARPNAEDYRHLTELIETGKLRPVIDRTYSLAQVPDAMRYLEEGHARGKIVVTV